MLKVMLAAILAFVMLGAYRVLQHSPLSHSNALGGMITENCDVTATVSLKNDTFLEDEPIPITLVVKNSTNESIRFFDEFPTAHPWIGGSRVAFCEKDHRLKVKVLEMNEAGGLMQRKVLKPGESFESTVILQRYLQQPSVGKYKVSYEFEFKIQRESDPSINASVIIPSSGTLPFTVEPLEPQKLRKIYQRYAEQLAFSNPSKKTACEALLVIDNPLVVPGLIKVLTSDLRPHGALESLARFPKDKAAVQAVVTCLDDRDPSLQCDALKILGDWRYEVNLDAIRTLLKSTNNQVHHAAVDYIKLIDLPEYDDLLN
jgi:hypothetical protein